VGGIALPRDAAGDQSPGAEETPSSGEGAAHLLDKLGQASRKALFIVLLCWAAILVLLVTHEDRGRFLSFEELETVFTVGILLVATYSGFRLGQWEKYRAIRRVVEELSEREGS
jgi:hypothetical protein